MGRFVKGKVLGAADTVDNLKRAAKAVGKAVQTASKKGAQVIAKDLRRRAPRAEHPDGNKPLRKRIKVTSPKLRGKELGAAVAKARSNVAHLVERGTVERKRASKNGASTGRIQPRPFALPAAQASAGAAVQTFAQALPKAIDQEVQRLVKRKLQTALKGKR